MIICTSSRSNRKEKMNISSFFFFFLTIHNNTHCTSSFMCLKRMRWNEREYRGEREMRACNYHIRRKVHRRSVFLDIESQPERERERENERETSSPFLSLILTLFECFFSRLPSIEWSVMPLCRMAIESMFIVLILFPGILSSTNESPHQILKVDLGQTVTFSCLFDQEKIDQVCSSSIHHGGRSMLLFRSHLCDKWRVISYQWVENYSLMNPRRMNEWN